MDWLSGQPTEVQELLQSLRCPLPPFHVKCHRWGQPCWEQVLA